MISDSQYPVLILNADYRPLSIFPLAVMNWRKAIRKVMLQKVTAVAEYERTVGSSAISIPSVVMLRRYVRVQRRVPLSRMSIWLRDNGRCVYCRCDLSTSEVTFDHVTPRSRGGTTSFENISSSCASCNLKKADRLPAEAGMIPDPWPYEPSQMEMARSARRLGKAVPTPTCWRDFIYWDGELESN